MNDLLLLGALMEGPQHGYALKRLAGLLLGHHAMHNNLVYPLLRRFVENSWVVKRTTDGHRGQKRDLYALTKGKLEPLQRLSRFAERQASSEDQFRVRVGLFSVRDRDMRERIVDQRDRFLARRQARLETIRTDMAAMKADAWATPFCVFYLSQLRAERKWITVLKRQARQRRKGKNRIVELQQVARRRFP